MLKIMRVALTCGLFTAVLPIVLPAAEAVQVQSRDFVVVYTDESFVVLKIDEAAQRAEPKADVDSAAALPATHMQVARGVGLQAGAQLIMSSFTRGAVAQVTLILVPQSAESLEFAQESALSDAIAAQAVQRGVKLQAINFRSSPRSRGRRHP